MRTVIYIILVFAVTTVSAKDRAPRMTIQNVEIEKKDNHLTVRFEAFSREFPSDYSLTLTPVVYDSNGHLKVLEPLTLMGRRSRIRRGEVRGETREMKKQDNGAVVYEYTFPREEWMKYISVSVGQEAEGCCFAYPYPLEPVAENVLIEYQPHPYYDVKIHPYELTELEEFNLDNPFLHPMEEYPQRYDFFQTKQGSGSSAVFFANGSHVIDINQADNRQVLSAAEQAFELIEKDPKAHLRKIVIAGYASPDGALAYNTQLAQRRAGAVKRYLQGVLGNPSETLFELYNGGENWDGLRGLVEESTLSEREEVLMIMDRYAYEPELRKTRLKQLNGGKTYRYLSDNIFPLLRSAGYIQVYYDVERSATGAQIVQNAQGKKVWVDPESGENRTITAMNKAMEWMVDGKYQEALEVLLNYSDDPRVWNSLGVCYLMTDSYPEAERFFRKAMANGDENAEKNLKQIEWVKTVNQPVR